MKKTNQGLVEYAKKQVGIPYVMGTNCRILTASRLHSLINTNPAKWFTKERIEQCKKWVGKVTADCQGLIEGYLNDTDKDGVVESEEGTYDTTADNAYNKATAKGAISTMDKSIIGQCVRYPGHVGVYIGNGKVIEARGFNYGVCITNLSARPWTHWYEHPEIKYKKVKRALKLTSPRMKGDDVKELQRLIGVDDDGVYGPDTDKRVNEILEVLGR
nr:NlpC/P60 family protein [uncultured Lachnoclostridium sp.]